MKDEDKKDISNCGLPTDILSLSTKKEEKKWENI